MFNFQSTEQDIETNFELFLHRLQEKSYLEWGILEKMFHKSIIPWLIKSTSKYGFRTFEVRRQLAEEVYAECWQTFYSLFVKGSFENLSKLSALMYSIADKKLKERVRANIKDGRILFTDNQEWINSFVDDGYEDDIKKEKTKEQITKVQKHLNKLPEKDKQILWRYANGEKLKDIADSLQIPQATCRKQKERALTKLKKHFFSV